MSTTTDCALGMEIPGLHKLMIAGEWVDPDGELWVDVIMPSTEDVIAGVSNPEMVPALIDETLRFWSPVNLIFQTAAQDIELYNVKIPKDSYMFSYFSSANRDERRFPDPDRFYLLRPKQDVEGYLSFAAGPHFCPGSGLSKRLASVAINAVLDRMPGICKLQPAVDVLRSLWVRRQKTLHVAY